ncbi:MAG: DUF58 domain-containing protein [Bacteroidota bacterium]|nr:MAG: DUF58 domain-containing protein [Bacteroidota bacterium]
MDTAELLKRVRRIEIKTRGLSQQIFAGEYHSAFKGKGMAFSEVREYQYGDDIRTIDWNVTARFNHPYVKIFEEERELTVMLLIDVSASGIFGSGTMLKRQLITELAAVIAFSAIQNNDKIGVLFFSDRIEKFIPPKKGRQHILRIIRELIDYEPQRSGTNISQALRYFTNVIKKRSTAFLISDFIDNNYEDAVKISAKKHDLIALNVFDIRESEIPRVGLVQLKDAETGQMLWVDTSDKHIRELYKKQFVTRQSDANDIFKRYGVDSANLITGKDYIKPLMNLFKSRI